jgi:hypothetical protein
VHARHPARVFASSFENRRITAFDADDAQEHDAENIMLDLNVQQQSGRWTQRAGARDLKRRDGRHPKTENHGRIAGC